MDDRLQAYIDILPFLSNATLGTTLLAVTDTRTFLACVPAGEWDPGIRAGDEVSETGSTGQAMREGRAILAEIPASEDGLTPAYIAGTLPIVRDGQVIGSFATAYPLNRQREMDGMSRTVATTVQTVHDTIRELLEYGNTMARSAESLQELAAATDQSAQKADEMATYIRDVAASTHLLGLNAAIESAHAGEFGKGFSVVAAEIRKMAAQNKEAAQSIAAFVSQLQTAIRNLTLGTRDLSAMSTSLTASLHDVATTIAQFQELAHRLQSLAAIRDDALEKQAYHR